MSENHAEEVIPDLSDIPEDNNAEPVDAHTEHAVPEADLDLEDDA